MMQVSPKGLAQIAADEAVVLAAYYDAVGVLTWGIGHTANAGKPDPKAKGFAVPTPEKFEGELVAAIRVFEKDVQRYADRVTRVLGPLQQHELDGWVSFDFNTGGITQTSAARKWKAGDKAGAVRIMQQWNKGTVGGKKVVLKGLVHRRSKEADLILNGTYAKVTIQIKETNGRGRVQRTVARLTSDDFIQRLKPVRPAGQIGNPFASLQRAMSGWLKTNWMTGRSRKSKKKS